MKDIKEYLDLAKAKVGFRTDMELNFSLGYKGLSVSHFRTGRKLPSDDVMVRIADMAGVPQDQALIDLNMWRAKGTAAAPVYERMAAMLRGVVLTALIAVGFMLVTSDNSAHAATIGVNAPLSDLDKTHYVSYGNAENSFLQITRY